MKTKIKTKNKKSFKKGDQCVQNPSTRRFRDQVKKNVFTRKSSGGLTVEALRKHEEDIDADIAFSDLAISDKSSAVTTKSKAFSISGLTDCTNLTFHNVWNKMNSSSSLDQEKCAILAAVTEIIRSKGGKETESEYFAALLTTLEATSEGEEAILAIAYLLSLVIKKVPSSLLKRKFSEASKLFVNLLEKYHAEGRASLVMSVIECMATLLQAQEGAVWLEASTMRCYEILLTFVIHTKPKVRKTAHACMKSIIKVNLTNHKNHPLGKITAAFINKILEQYNTENSTSIHHALNFLKQCLQYFNGEQLKELCESILRTMAINNVIIKTNAMQTLHALFLSRPSEDHLSKELNGKLISALYDFQPSMNDIHVAEAWMTLMVEAHANLSIIDDDFCLKVLPKLYGTLLTYFQSEHREVAVAAANIMKEISEKCLEPCIDMVQNDLEKKNSSMLQIFKLMESGLRYKFQPVWDIVLQSLHYLYLIFGRISSSKIISGVSSLIDLHDSPDFPCMNDLNKAVGAAFTGIGPQKILEEKPLNLIRDDNVCEFPRAWMLPIMKDYVCKTELQYFISHFLPIAAQLRQKGLKCRETKQDLEAKVYETLQSQIWALLPGFCTEPTDLKDSFKNIAKILGTALMERSEIRSVVLQAMRTLINKTQDEEELKVIGNFSKNYLPILFNLYTSDNEDCKAISLSVLETIKLFLVITNDNLIHVFIKTILEKLENAELKVQERHQVMDLAICMTKYANENLLDRLFGFAVNHIKSNDRSMQKKSYRIIEEICDSNSEVCKNLIKNKFDELKSILVDSLSTAVPSSKSTRLHCISSLMKKLDASHKDFINQTLAEVILCTKEVGVKAKTTAFDLLVDIGNTLVFLSPRSKEDCIEEYFQLVMAGLAGSPHMISATLLAFTKLIFHYRDTISTQIIATLLDSSITLLKSKTREVIKSSLYFIRAVVKILDANELSGHLERLIKNLFAWNTNTKSAYRQQIRVILEKLDKKCGYQLVRSLVPDPHKKFIVQIHKTLMRTKNQKEAYRNSVSNEDDENSKKENTWEDILADSDDEENHDKNIKKKRKDDSKKKNKHHKSWIVEGEDTVDLLDPKISRNITATKPKNKPHKGRRDEFSMSSDGKFIIKDEETKTEESVIDKPLNVGEKDMLGGFMKTPKQIKLGKRKHLEDMPDDDMISEYQPGGKGIHRKRDEDPPVKKKFGEEYKARKAHGDMKLKGKPDPFAYIPLDRQKLNKRKRAKLAGQYSGLVKAARKGASRGGKFKKRK